MKRLRADRIEEEFLVCISDEGEVVNIPLDKLPAGVGEGWFVTISDGEKELVYTVSAPSAESLEKKHKRFAKLFRKNS